MSEVAARVSGWKGWRLGLGDGRNKGLGFRVVLEAGVRVSGQQRRQGRGKGAAAAGKGKGAAVAGGQQWWQGRRNGEGGSGGREGGRGQRRQGRGRRRE